MFSALRNRDYLLYWTGALVSFTGSWVQSVCYTWLVYEITGSKFWLGLVGFIQALPLLGLTLFSGAIADRVDKRKTLIVTQGLFVVFAASLGVLYQTHNLNNYSIIAVAFLQGIVLSLDMPIRQAMPASLVPKKDLMNAIVLNSASFNGARIIGPALGALTAAKLGIALCFYINAISFVAVIIALLMMHTRTPATPSNGKPVLHDMLDGLRYVLREHRILKLMLILAISSLFVMPYITLMPVFAKDILKAGIKGNGFLLTSVGIGALAGALLLAMLSSMPRKGRILLVSSAIGSLMLIAFANSRVMIISEMVLVGLGFCMVSFNQTANTLIQGATDNAYRGRVMSTYVFVFMGLSPFANLQAGLLAQAIGAPMTVTIWGIILLCLAIFIATRRDILDLG